MPATLTEEPAVGKKQENTSVKLARDVHQMAKTISDATHEPMSDMLSNLLRPLLARRLPDALKKLQAFADEMQKHVEDDRPRKGR